MSKPDKYTHYCEYILPHFAYGDAITVCYENENGLAVENGEYGNYVNYCPYCGYKAKKQVEMEIVIFDEL